MDEFEDDISDGYVEPMGYESEYPEVSPDEPTGKLIESEPWEEEIDMMTPEEIVLDLIETASKASDDVEAAKIRTVHLINVFSAYQDPDAERKNFFGEIV